MAVRPKFRRAWFRRSESWRLSRLARLPGATIVRRIVSDPLDRTRDVSQGRAEVRKVDHREQQSCNPEQVDMGEQREEPQDSDDLELQLLRLVSHPLRQRVQFQIEIANREDGDDQDDPHHDHQDIRFAGCRDEGGQMVRS